MAGLNRKIFVGSLIVLALFGLAGCDEDDSQSDGGQNAPSVIVAEVVLRDIRDSERFIGRVEAQDSMGLRARVEGFLEVRDARDGASVTEGETLFVIEPAPYEADVAQANAAVAEARAALALADVELDRKTELLSRGTIPQSEQDVARASRAAAEARLEAAEAQLGQAEIRLGYTEISAPFDGRLGRIAFSKGEMVGPTSGPLATLTRISPIFVTFAISERDLITVLERVGTADGKIDPAAAAIVSVDLPNGARLPEEGRLVFLDNQVNPKTGTIDLRAEFKNQSGVLVPGIFVGVEVGAREPDERNVIPQAALQQDQQGEFVLVVGDDGLVEQRYVRLGATQGIEVVVMRGVETGEKVIVEGLQRVRKGQPVEAIPAPPLPDPEAGNDGPIDNMSGAETAPEVPADTAPATSGD